MISYDARGVGNSDAPEGPYTVDLLAADALRVLDSANVPRAHVLGVSLGGMVAQTLALAHPQRVGGLILGGSTHGGREAEPVPDAFIKLCVRWADEPFPNDSPLVDEFMSWMVPADTAATPAGAKLMDLFKWSFLQTPRHAAGLRGQLAAMGRFNSTKRLGELHSHPTLAICGERDAVMSPANSESIAQRIGPSARVQMWEGAGHFFWAHRPREASSAISDFLVECDARSGSSRWIS